MALSAVGNKKLCVTRWRERISNASCASKRPLYATIGRPKYSVGSNASIKPPVHAQSAGLQKMARLGRPGAPGSKPNQLWLHTKPGRLPISARCGISAPLGGPVVPLV